MGTSRSHPLPPGIFVEMKPSPNEFDDWTEEDFDNEIKRLHERIKELKSQKMFVRWLKMVNTLVTCLTHLAKHVKMMRTNHSQVGQFHVHTFERVE